MGLNEKELIEQATDHLARSSAYYDQMRLDMREALDFVAGNQWDADAQRIYNQQKRMMLTMDRISPRIERLIGEQRQARPSINVRAVQPEYIEPAAMQQPNVMGDKSYELSDVLTGLIKSIESDSDAYIAYDQAYDHALQCGLGGWRILTEYEQNSFYQKIVIKPIPNPLSIWPDSDAQRMQDMRYCFLGLDISEEEYERRYKKKPESSSSDSPWYSTSGIRTTEYFWIESDTKKILLLSNGQVVDDYPDLRQQLEAQGIQVVREREAEINRCKWAVLDGNTVLQEPQEFPSQFIPIALVTGRPLIDSQGRRYYRGLVKPAMDAQRLYNFSRTTSAETMALQPKAPFIVADEQLQGYEGLWATANTELHSYLPYRHIDGVSPPGRATPSSPNQAAIAEARMAEEDIDATTGVHRSHLGNLPADSSGKALDTRIEEAQGGTFFFYDNLQSAIKYTGRVLVDMIPRVYDTPRIVTMINSDESEDYVRWMSPSIDQDTGQVHEIPDLSTLKYVIDINVTPYGSTRRRRLVESLEMAVQTNPELWSVVGDLLFQNMDIPGAEALAERMKKALKPGIIDDGDITQEQIQQMVLEQVHAYGLDIEQQKVATQRMEAEAKAKIDAVNAQIKAVEAQAKAETADEKNEIERMKVMLSAMQQHVANLPDGETIQDLVAQAIAQFITEAAQEQQQEHQQLQQPENPEEHIDQSSEVQQ